MRTSRSIQVETVGIEPSRTKGKVGCWTSRLAQTESRSNAPGQTPRQTTPGHLPPSFPAVNPPCSNTTTGQKPPRSNAPSGQTPIPIL